MGKAARSQQMHYRQRRLFAWTFLLATISPHRVIGRAGRAVGVATLTVTSGNEVMSIPITVIPPAAGRTR